MLLGNDKRQADIAEFEKRPSRIVIGNTAFEARLPVYGCGDVAHADGEVIENIEGWPVFLLVHDLKPFPAAPQVSRF